MTNNKETTKISPKIIQISEFQLFDDLNFAYVSQEEINEIDNGPKGSVGLCAASRSKNRDTIFFIFVKRDLDPEIFLKVFYHEFYHYCINRIFFKWLDPQSTSEIPLFGFFISEMLSDEACWDCEHFGRIDCWKHPNNPIQNANTIVDKDPLGLCKEIKRTLEDCLALKTSRNYDDQKDSLYAQLNSIIRCLRTCL